MIETCQQYVDRRLSEGWKIVGRFGHFVYLSPPDGAFIRPVDLRDDIETLRPNAAGDESNLHVHGATYNWQCVDEESPDDDTTYVYSAHPDEGRDLYNLPASSGTGAINSVKVYIHARGTESSVQDAKPALKIHGVAKEGTNIDLTASYANYSQQWNTNPATNQAWEWPEIDDLQIGVWLDYVSGKETNARCTQVYVEIDYSPGQPSVITLRPNAAGSQCNIEGETGCSACPDHYTCVDEIVPDDGTSCVRTDETSYQRDLYNIEAPDAIPDGATINFIEICFRCETDGGYAKPSLRGNGIVTDGNEVLVGMGWTTYSQQWNTNPADGQPWEKSDISSLQIGVALRYSGGKYGVDCTQVHVKVSYSPPLQYKDISTRFKLTVQSFLDIATRFKLLPPESHKDVATRFRLFAQGYKDTATRFKLVVLYKDIATRFRLFAQGYNDIGARFKLLPPASYQDVSTRFFLYQPSWKSLQILGDLAALEAKIARLKREPKAHFEI